MQNEIKIFLLFIGLVEKIIFFYHYDNHLNSQIY